MPIFTLHVVSHSLCDILSVSCDLPQWGGAPHYFLGLKMVRRGHAHCLVYLPKPLGIRCSLPMLNWHIFLPFPFCHHLNIMPSSSLSSPSISVRAFHVHDLEKSQPCLPVIVSVRVIEIQCRLAQHDLRRSWSAMLPTRQKLIVWMLWV